MDQQFEFEGYTGVGMDHSLVIKDNAGVSDVLDSAVYLSFYTNENGRNVIRYQGNVPNEAMTQTAEGIQIAVGQLGVSADYLKVGIRVHMEMTVTRTLGSQTSRYALH